MTKLPVRPLHLRLSVPDHKELRKGTLLHILKAVGLTAEELKALLQ